MPRLVSLTAAVLAALAATGSLAAHMPVSPRAARPTIALVTIPGEQCEAPPPEIVFDDASRDANGFLRRTCSRGTYTSWLNAAGVRVVPLPWNAPKDDRLAILNQTDGVLFPGGSLDELPGLIRHYFENAKDIFKQAEDWCDAGRPFVVWGTCQGFQMLNMIAADNMSVVVPGFTGMDPTMLPLDLSSTFNQSMLFGTTPQHIIEFLSNDKSTLNYHHDGVKPSSYQENPKLRSTFEILSHNTDSNDVEFVSTIESVNKSRPFFGTQWHPEWPPFDFHNRNITNTAASVAVSQHMSFILREQLLKSHTTWRKEVAEKEAQSRAIDKLVMRRHPSGDLGFGRVFWFIGGHYRTSNPHTHGAAADESDRRHLAVTIIAAVAALVVGGVIGFVAARAHARRSQQSSNEGAYAQVQ